MKKFLVTWGLLAIAAICAAVLAFVYWGDIPFKPHTKASELGQLGDFFGGLLNPIVSALTLFVAIKGWCLQKPDKGKRIKPLAAKYGLIKYPPKTKLCQEAENKLEPLVFGRKFAHATALSRSSEGVSL